MNALDFFLAKFHYIYVFVLLLMGLYTLVTRQNLIKKVIGMTVFQTAVLLFYVSAGRIAGGTAPILLKGAPEGQLYDNPLTHCLMLTAIVVGVATAAVALSLIIRIKQAYGTIEEDEVLEQADKET